MSKFQKVVEPHFFYGWWVAFACAAVILLTAGTFFYGFGILINPLEDEFGWSRAAISVAFSLRTEVGGIAAPLVGVLVDRLGPRILMIGGIFIVAAGFLSLSQVSSLWTFYAAVVLIAIGMSAANGGVPNVVVTHWFRRRRGRALGLMALGGGLSGIAAVFFAWLVDSYGWRDALVVTAILQFGLALPFVLSIRNRPQELGLQPDGEAAPDLDTVEGAARHARDMQGMTAREALRSSVFWRVSLAFGLSNFATTGLIVHQVPFLTETAHMSDTAAAASVTALTVLSILGRVGLGAMTDFVAKKVVMAVCLVAIGVSLALFTQVTSVWHLSLVLPLFAIGHGGLVPVRSQLQADYFGLRAFGSIQGFQLTVSTFGAFLGPVLAGYMYDVLENYELAFVFLAVAPLAGVPLIMSTRQPRWKDRGDEPATTAPVTAA